jgi:hypothetical protein
MNKVLRRRPSASLVISIVALVVAASGTAVAASTLVNGDSLIKKRSLSGNRLRNRSITGTQVNLNKLGKVPSAKNADTAITAGSATNATNATNAGNANTIGGLPPSAFLTASNRIGTNGITDVTGTLTGNAVTLFTVAPFTVTLTCTRAANGNTTAALSASSSEANSFINGSFVSAANKPTNLNVDVGPTTNASDNNGNIVDFESPSGVGVQMLATDGVNSLGTDCWANWVGIH